MLVFNLMYLVVLMNMGLVLRNVMQYLACVNGSVLGRDSKVRSIYPIYGVVKCFSFLNHSLSPVYLVLYLIDGWRINRLEHSYHLLVLNLLLSSVPMVRHNVLNVIEH